MNRQKSQNLYLNQKTEDQMNEISLIIDLTWMRKKGMVTPSKRECHF